MILNSVELLGSLNHVITITLRIRYMGCYNYALNCKFVANEFHSKPQLICDLQLTTAQVEHVMSHP
jgi:hypothetical protein